MKNYKFLMSIVTLALLASVIFVSPATGIGQENRGEDTIAVYTDNIVVEILGGANNPFFFFYQPSEENITYKLQLEKIFESEDFNDNGEYDYLEEILVNNTMVSLPSLEWEFSEFELINDTNGVTTNLNFNLTSTHDKALELNGTNINDDFYIQFRMHMDVAESAQLKFDVVIDDYTFTSDTSNLILSFRLFTTQNEEMVRTNSSFAFGNAFFDSEESANDTNGHTEVGVSSMCTDAESRIYLSYEHFDGLMVHDPTIGFTEDAVDDNVVDSIAVDTVADNTITDEGALSLSGVFAFFAFILVPVTVYRKKRN